VTKVLGPIWKEKTETAKRGQSGSVAWPPGQALSQTK
jgi:hypothetical protein